MSNAALSAECVLNERGSIDEFVYANLLRKADRRCRRSC